MAMIQLMGDTKTKRFAHLLTVLVVAALLGAGGFVGGYLKGAASCKTINVSKAQKSLVAAQAASRNTATFTLKQQQQTQVVKKQIKEVTHECLPTPMPFDLIDALNK